MNSDILKSVIASVSRRVEQGDFPREPAHSTEVLENAIMALVKKPAISSGGALRVDWNKHDLAEAYDLVEGLRHTAAQDPESNLDTSLRYALDAIEAADCEWDGLTKE